MWEKPRDGEKLAGADIGVRYPIRYAKQIDDNTKARQTTKYDAPRRTLNCCCSYLDPGSLADWRTVAGVGASPNPNPNLRRFALSKECSTYIIRKGINSHNNWE
jgi:hypothetical protein